MKPIFENEVQARKIIFIASFFQVFISLFFDDFSRHKDSYDYEQVYNWLNGSGDSLDIYRLYHGLEILVAYILPNYFSFDQKIILINTFLYLIMGQFFFTLILEKFDDMDLAFFSTIILVESFCILYWGLSILTDIMVWCLLVVGLVSLLRLYNQFDKVEYIKILIVIAIGLFNKESIILLFPLLILVLLKQNDYNIFNSDFIFYLTLSGLLFVPFLIYSLYLYYEYDFNAISWHLIPNEHNKLRVAPLYLLLTFIIAFNIMIPNYFHGIKNNLRGNLISRNEYLFSAIIFLIPIILFKSFSPRLSFLLFPLIIPFFSVSILSIIRKTNKNIYFILFLLFYSIINNIISIFGDEIRNIIGLWSRL